MQTVCHIVIGTVNDVRSAFQSTRSACGIDRKEGMEILVQRDIPVYVLEILCDRSLIFMRSKILKVRRAFEEYSEYWIHL